MQIRAEQAAQNTLHQNTPPYYYWKSVGWFMIRFPESIIKRFHLISTFWQPLQHKAAEAIGIARIL